MQLFEEVIERMYRIKKSLRTKEQRREKKIKKYRASGIKIGEGCIFCCELPTGRDSTLLSFGDHCLVSVNVRFLMHDAAPTTVSDGFTDILGEVNIGNRCFIGADSIIMPGVTLADYTVVGAGSVVTRSTNEPGLVIAGNPAKVICTVKEYLEKNKDKLVNLDGMGREDIKEYFEKYPEKLLER